MIIMPKDVNELICNPDPERVVEGLRDTGYNFNTAIADIIDNSIAAEASRIDITINDSPMEEITVYVADNGIGMNEAELVNAMKYGSAKRSNPDSLGKFGLGLKTASTAFCRCLSVVSRSTDGKLRKAQWDLDYVSKSNEWKLKMPVPNKDEENILNSTAGEGTGTLVVWENIDRLMKKYNQKSARAKALKKKIDELMFHVSMVYQRFLDPNDNRAKNITITINGIEIHKWDPFVTDEKETELLAEETVDVELPDGKETSFTLKAYMIPRRGTYSTPQAQESARVNNDMQGFYVYRENRLIHSGDWFGMFTKEPHFSLLRIEFSFDYTLDSTFDIDIKKSRIIIADKIFDYIKNNFTSAPRRAAEERYRDGTKKQVSGKTNASDAHSASNTNIDKNAAKAQESNVTVTGKDEIEIQNKNGTFRHKITIKSQEKPGQVRVIPVETLDANQLWSPCIVDGKKAVQINMSHPYYQKVYYPVINQSVMVTGMDALLWALSEAEHGTYNEETREYYEEMRIMVSNILKKLLVDLPEPDNEDE